MEAHWESRPLTTAAESDTLSRNSRQAFRRWVTGQSVFKLSCIFQPPESLFFFFFSLPKWILEPSDHSYRTQEIRQSFTDSHLQRFCSYSKRRFPSVRVLIRARAACSRGRITQVKNLLLSKNCKKTLRVKEMLWWEDLSLLFVLISLFIVFF